MREIKFRAWDKVEKKMSYRVEGKPIDIYAGYVHFGYLLHSKRFIVMQYTGLKDKNGKEIYEGDIIKFIVNNKKEVSKVFFDEGGFSVYAKNNDPDYKPYLGEIGSNFKEVIGNIYENPELMEKK